MARSKDILINSSMRIVSPGIKRALPTPAPVNPWYGAGAGGAPADKITSPDGERFARLGDELSELILLVTALYPALPANTNPAVRTKLAEASLALMKEPLKKVGQRIVTIERDSAQPDPPLLVSHICFAKPSVQPGADPHALVARIRTLIDQGAATADEIVAHTLKLPRKLTAQGIAKKLRNDIRPIFDQFP